MNNFPENSNSNEKRQYLNAIAIILMEIVISISMIKNIEDYYDFQNINDSQLYISQVASKSKNHCQFPFAKNS